MASKGAVERSTSSRLRHVRSVLKVVLENLRSEGWTYSLSRRPNRSDNLSSAYDFGGRATGDFCRQHQVDLQLSIGLKHLFRLEQKSGAADVFGSALQPALF